MSDHTLGVYVHVPFCERVCPYCDFAVVATRALTAGDEDRYVAALLAELALRRGAYAGLRLETVYLGGGTPSLLRPESVARILAAVGAAFPGAPREVTLEVNPSSLERERLPGFRAAGIDRISLGIQSFDDGTLKRLGRAHRAEEGWATLAAVRAAGFRQLSVDLIVAVPGQSEAQVDADLDALLADPPGHASVYELSVETGTPYARGVATGQLVLPEEDAALGMLERAEARLAAAGLERYEISSYARPGAEAVHNRRYWQRRPVLGLGLGAWSHTPAGAAAPHGARSGNLRDLGAYLARVEAGALPDAEPPERLSAATARGEAMLLGLRTREGVAAAAFAAEFGAPPRGYFDAAVDTLCEAGLLLEAKGGDLRLSPRGRGLADSVALHFVAAPDATA